MPYKLSEDGLAVMVQKSGKWVVQKRYPDHRSAVKYLAALEINVPEAKKELLTGVKAFENNGAKYLWLWTSNAFQDRDHEIIETKAWQDYVDRRDAIGGKYDRVWFWHLKGSDFADVVWTDVEGRFLLELAKMDDTSYGTKMFDAITHPGDHADVAPDGFGTSHGYLYRDQDRHDGVYSRVEKFESTVLPFHVASNLYGGVKEVLDMTKHEDKVAALASLIGKEEAEAKLAEAKEATTVLERAGISYKEAKDKKKPAPAANEADEDPEEEAAESTDEEAAEDTEEVAAGKTVKGKKNPFAKKEAEDDDQVMELEVDDVLVKEIAKQVDVQAKVKEAMDAAIPGLESQIQNMVEKAIKANIDQLMGTKEQVAKEIMSGRITLKPYVASKAGDNRASKEQVESDKAAKTNKDRGDVVKDIVHAMLTGSVE